MLKMSRATGKNGTKIKVQHPLRLSWFERCNAHLPA